MAKQTLNLGAVLSDILKNSNSNFTELYDAIAKIQEKIADDGEKAVVYSTVDKMIAGLNAGTDEVGKALDITIGDEIYILDDETPDFWVSAVSSTSTTGTKPESWEKGVNYAFGKYTIRVSKSREIDLADYQKIANMDTGSALGSDVTKDRYPSSFTVYSWVTNLLTTINAQISTLNSKAHTHGNKDLLDTYKQTETNLADAVSKKHSHANKALLDTYDQTNANIKDAISKKHSHSNKSVLDATTASYTTEEKTKLGNIDSSLEGVTADEIGKVKDVTVNGASVLDDDGTAKITVDDLEGELEIVLTTDSRWTTKGGNHCLKVPAKDDLHFAAYNSNGYQLVTQEELLTDGGQPYVYINFGATKPTYTVTLRKIKGNSVTSGAVTYKKVTIAELAAQLSPGIMVSLVGDNTVANATGVGTTNSDGHLEIRIPTAEGIYLFGLTPIGIKSLSLWEYGTGNETDYSSRFTDDAVSLYIISK